MNNKTTATVAPGNIAYSYTVCKGSPSDSPSAYHGPPPRSSTGDGGQLASKLDYKVHQADKINKWNHYDSNMTANLVEQRKILYSKNYELDSRAWGLKDFGCQPFMTNKLDQHRKIDNVLFKHVRGKEPEERVP